MTREEFLDLLARLRRASVGNVRAPHKPLLLLWLFGRFAATGSTAAAYAEAEEPVSTLINDFGPPVAKASAGRQRAAMPFVHLEREIWDLRDGSGAEIGPDAPERGPWLAGRGSVGRLRLGAEQLLADPGTLAAAARLLLDLHFTPSLAAMICDAVGLDLAVLELAASPAVAAARRSLRRPGFAEEVLRAYAYQCAMCGFDGAMGRNPVGLEAAHVRWHSQDGPDVVANGLALCTLHHALFDLGVLGLTAELHIRVSSLYVARSDAGRRAVDDLSGQLLLAPRPGQPVVEVNHVDWHHRQVFKGSESRPHKSRSGFDTDRPRPIFNSISDLHSALLLSVGLVKRTPQSEAKRSKLSISNGYVWTGRRSRHKNGHRGLGQDQARTGRGLG